MRIALIAMSGVRAHNKELTDLGLTLPGFVDRNKIIASLPSLGLLTLAGLTPDEFDVEYIEVADIKDVGTLSDGFDLVAISTYSAQIFEAYELSQRYSACGVTTVMGGPHVTCLPEEAKQYCDAVVIGEGEPVWCELLEDFKNGRMKPFYNSFDKDFSLENSPMPRFDLLDPEKYNRITIQTTRGCPHRCEFCAASILISKSYKQKPAERVLREIQEIKKIWDKPFIEFADDNSFVDKAYWKDLLNGLRLEGIKWFSEADISVAEDEELLTLLHESGCQQILIGFESPTEIGLDGLELRSNWKVRQLDKYRDAIHKIQSHGITVNGCFILGLDGHDKTIFNSVFEFVKESGLYEVQITVMTAFPGTPLYERLIQEKRVIQKDDWSRCTLFDVNYHPQNMTAKELEKGFRDLAEKLYSAEFTKQRKANYKNILKGCV
ncbi:MAG: B12-binding domain-containing radical SAM protein [Kiritimatiellae bacterium]|nr:B12-binding domain-containing radical SAM protein [Kiritimatiellia bacterium]